MQCAVIRSGWVRLVRNVMWVGGWARISLVAAALTGCAPQSPAPNKAPASATGGATSGTASDTSSTAAPSATSENVTSATKDDKIAAALAKLSPEDRKSAEAQKICPVSQKPLGSMDTPVK